MLRRKHSITHSELLFPQFICHLCDKSIPIIKQISIKDQTPFITYKCPCSVEKTEELSTFLAKIINQNEIAIGDLPKRKPITPIRYQNNYSSMFSYSKKLSHKYSEVYKENVVDKIEKQLPFHSLEGLKAKVFEENKRNEDYYKTQIRTIDFYIEKFKAYKKLLKEEYEKNKKINYYLTKLYYIIYSNYLQTKSKPIPSILQNLDILSKFNLKSFAPVSINLEANVEALINYYKKNFFFSTSEKKNKSFRDCSELINQNTRGIITSFLLLKDGRIASGLTDKSIQIFDLITKKTQFSLEGHQDTISSLAQTRSDQLISGSYDCTIKIWDIQHKYSCLMTLNQINCKINSILFYPENQSNIVVAGSDGSISVWDVNSCQQILNEKKSNESISLVIPLKKQNTLAAVSNTSIMIIESPTMKVIKTLNEHKSKISSVIQLREGKLASVSVDSVINVWNGDNYELLRSIRGNSINNLIELNDGRVIASSNENCLAVWDFNTYQISTFIIPETLQSVKVQLSDGRIVSVISKGKFLSIH